MKPLVNCLTGCLALSILLIACTGAPNSSETLEIAETIVLSETATSRPTKQIQEPATTLPQPTGGLGHLSPLLKMSMKRAAHTATLLPDGSVLIAGGFRSEGASEVPIASAEIYDPETNTFTPTGAMNVGRSGHTATLLPNNLVLIAGGWGAKGRLSSAELFDPRTREFRYVASMSWPRASMTATLLRNGRVLIAGGDSASNKPQMVAEIFDPETNEFSLSGTLNHGRSAHTATLLNDGTVLIIGGRPRYDNSSVLSSAEIYNPVTGEFQLTGSTSVGRYKHAAVLLRSGDVLVLGGADERDWTGKYNSAEIYDVGAGTFGQIANMHNERFKLAGTAVLLNNGNVFVGGGNRRLEIFDALSQHFIPTVTVDDAYYFSVSTLLQDGTVLITGGYDANIQPSEKAWIYSYGY
jgi:hypothetical protein